MTANYRSRVSPSKLSRHRVLIWRISSRDLAKCVTGRFPRPSPKVTPCQRESLGSRLPGSSQASNLVIKTMENAINSTSAIFHKDTQKKGSLAFFSSRVKIEACPRHQSLQAQRHYVNLRPYFITALFRSFPLALRNLNAGDGKFYSLTGHRRRNPLAGYCSRVPSRRGRRLRRGYPCHIVTRTLAATATSTAAAS